MDAGQQKGPYNPNRRGKWQDKSKTSSPVAANIAVPEPVHYEIVESIKPMSHKDRDVVYKAMLSCLTLEDYHREYLHQEGWSDDLIENINQIFPNAGCDPGKIQ